MPTPPPPRGVQAAVVVVAEGPRVAGSTALHGLVRAGSSGLLALQGPPGAAVPAAAEAAAGGGAEDEEPEVAASLRLLGQLTGSADLAARFRGLRSVLLSTCRGCVARGRALGFAGAREVVSGAGLEACVARCLPGGEDPHDLVVLHVREPCAGGEGTSWLDQAVAYLRRRAAADGAGLYLACLAHCDLGEGSGRGARAAGPAGYEGLRRPTQSSQVDDAVRIPRLAWGAAILAVHYGPELTRRDAADAPADVIARGGGCGTVFAGHLLRALAYKLERAPKYGA